MNSWRDVTRRSAATCLLLSVLVASTPVRRSQAQGWEVALSVVSGVSGYLTGKQNRADQREIKHRLAEIQRLLSQANAKLTLIQQALVAMGDYLEEQFDEIYVSNLRTALQLADQEMEKYLARPGRYRNEIASELQRIRVAAIALQARPPEAYDWVGSAMVYEDVLATLLPPKATSRVQMFESHAAYFSQTSAAFQSDADRLGASIARIEAYHGDLATNRPILQYIKIDHRGTRNCYEMRMKVYRVIEGTLADGYELTAKEVTRNDRCIRRTEPRLPGDGPRSPFLSRSGIGTPQPEEEEPVIPSKVTIGELNASRADWLKRRARLETVRAMVADCEQYLEIARTLGTG